MYDSKGIFIIDMSNAIDLIGMWLKAKSVDINVIISEEVVNSDAEAYEFNPAKVFMDYILEVLEDTLGMEIRFNGPNQSDVKRLEKYLMDCGMDEYMIDDLHRMVRMVLKYIANSIRMQPNFDVWRVYKMSVTDCKSLHISDLGDYRILHFEKKIPGHYDQVLLNEILLDG